MVTCRWEFRLCSRLAPPCGQTLRCSAEATRHVLYGGGAVAHWCGEHLPSDLRGGRELTPEEFLAWEVLSS